MNKSYAQKLVDKTQQDYNQLAKEFSATRAFAWEELKDLIQHVKPQNKILDAGCGNGRLFQLLRHKNINYLGIDNSQSLISEAKQKYPNASFQIMDLLNMQFEPETFDIIFCIAALQHIPSKKFRLQVLRDFNHFLKPNGLLIMTNWNLWQKKYFFNTLKFSLLSLAGKYKELDLKDIYMPWRARFGTVDRYYHAFTPKELNCLLKQANFKIIKSYYVQHGQKVNWLNGHNLCTISQKY